MERSSAISSALNFLVSCQNPDGGWGYGPRHASAVEPSCATILALREAPSAAQSLEKAVAWIKKAQNPDGGWGINSGDPESAWHTSWAVLALARNGEGGDAVCKGVQWLLGVKTLEMGEDVIQNAKKLVRIDFSLRGWPWLPGQASWVEPTALAMLALKFVPGLVISTERLNESIRYLEDRRCSGGGWNVGNPFMFDSCLPARVHQSAWVMLALTQCAKAKILPEDISALRSEMHQDGGALALAWGLLTLRTIGQDDYLAETRLISMQEKNGGWGNDPYKAAIALMGMKGSY